MFSFLFLVPVVISYVLLVSMFFWVIDKIKYLPITMGKKRNDRTPETAYNVGGESSSTSNTLNSTPGRKYDVFLSFAGKDTRLKFADHLYHALSTAGINAFRDNEGIKRGEVISEQLIQAIKDSSCAVVVLSENYANSTWCLDELQSILQCKRELGQQVFPIFYDIDPSDLRHQRKNFGKALAKHEKRFRLNRDKVQKWRSALSEISDLNGLDTRGWPEAKLIRHIVANVWTYLRPKMSSYDDNLVGIESRVCDMMKFLEIELDDKRFVGIWGMGGIGKTTLARVVYKRISLKLFGEFDVCCFIVNVRDTLQKEGLVSLQEKLLSDLKIEDMKISDKYEGKEMIIKHLSNKKVLLVLDDLDDTSQLENLAESPDWFGKGSRILITTRDKHLLTASGVYRIYDMKTMERDESLQLFLKKAFKEDYPKQDFLEFSESVVEYAGGLPLALQTLGSFLCGRSEDEWRDALDRLKKIPDKNILQLLKITYDVLKEEEKTIFLDIACFFRGMLKKEVTQMLKSCNLHPTIGIRVLIEKALLVETKDGTLEMHDLIEELGRDIVHQESPNDVYKRSRLWKFKDIKEVLENNKGSNAIQAIVVQNNDENQGSIKVHPKAFSKMSSIRLLILEDTETDSPLILPRRFKLPGTLKVVKWRSFPLEALPIETCELVQLEMSGNRIKQLWKATQPMKMMRFINLSCPHLIEIPDFSRVPCLERLCLRNCTSLVKVHPSLGELKELVEVDLHDCKNLEILPRKLKTNALVKLDLGGCIKVVVLPEFGKGMEKLSYLDVSYTAITRLPESFGSLTGLRDLNLSRCGLNDGSIPNDFGSLSLLIVLDLSYNDFVNLPTNCFSSLFRLLYLSLDYCGKLKSLPRLPPRLIRLNASHCESMEPLLSDRQLWNLVASLDHEYRGQTEYVISDEEYDDTPSMFRHIGLEHLPLRDFFANVPGCKIPSWFPNKYVPSNDPSYEHVIEVKIPPYLRDSEWSGIVVCLHFSDDFRGLISWSSKAPEDDDYIREEPADYVREEWAHCSYIGGGQNRHLCIMVLELNEKTCWQHLKARDNSLNIKLYTYNDYAPSSPSSPTPSPTLFDGKTCSYSYPPAPYYPTSFDGKTFPYYYPPPPYCDCKTNPFYYPPPPYYPTRFGRHPISKLECGWRLICKEEIQKWCSDNDFNQLTLPQLAPPRDEVQLPLRVLDEFNGSVYERLRDVDLDPSGCSVM